MKAKVHVAGAGVISAIGASWAESLKAFKTEQSGIQPSKFIDSVHRDKLPVGEVKYSNAELSDRLGIKPVTRTALLGLFAAQQAIQHAGINALSDFRSGLISGTTVGGMDRTEYFFSEFIQDTTSGNLDDVVHHECRRHTELIAKGLGHKGFVATINTACSSSVNSIIYGARLIASNQLDVVVAGGADALTKFTLNGFNSLMILDSQPCRPFDASRNGLNLGEGAGYVVLVSDKILREQGMKSLGIVSGFANTNDAYHQTASSPEGRGSYASMQQALTMSGLSTQDIDYINLHGTGTANNDLSEGVAIKKLFGDAVPPLSSTKAFTGHTLGASGGIEAVFSLMSLNEQCLFPNLRFQTAMPELNFVPQQQFENAVVRNVLSNAFGFGGNCSSIIFSSSTT